MSRARTMPGAPAAPPRSTRTTRPFASLRGPASASGARLGGDLESVAGERRQFFREGARLAGFEAIGDPQCAGVAPAREKFLHRRKRGKARRFEGLRLSGAQQFERAAGFGRRDLARRQKLRRKRRARRAARPPRFRRPHRRCGGPTWARRPSRRRERRAAVPLRPCLSRADSRSGRRRRGRRGRPPPAATPAATTACAPASRPAASCRE